MSDLGSRILKARKIRGFTQKKLAEALGVTVQAVSQWETGKTEPIDRIGRISAALHCDPLWLTGDLNEAPPKEEGLRIVRWSSEVPLLSLEDMPYYLSFLSQSDPPKPKMFLSTHIEPVGRFFAINSPEDTEDFKKGDIMIFDNGIEALPGDVAAFIIINKSFAQLITGRKEDPGQTPQVTGLVGRFRTDMPGSVSDIKSALMFDKAGGAPTTQTVLVVATLVEHRTFRRR